MAQMLSMLAELSETAVELLGTVAGLLEMVAMAQLLEAVVMAEMVIVFSWKLTPIIGQ